MQEKSKYGPTVSGKNKKGQYPLALLLVAQQLENWKGLGGQKANPKGSLRKSPHLPSWKRKVKLDHLGRNI